MTRPDLSLVPPAAESSAPGEDVIADLDKALRDGSPDSPWRGCLFTLRRLLVEQAGASPLRSVDWSAEGEDR